MNDVITTPIQPEEVGCPKSYPKAQTYVNVTTWIYNVFPKNIFSFYLIMKIVITFSKNFLLLLENGTEMFLVQISFVNEIFFFKKKR